MRIFRLQSENIRTLFLMGLLLLSSFSLLAQNQDSTDNQPPLIIDPSPVLDSGSNIRPSATTTNLDTAAARFGNSTEAIQTQFQVPDIELKKGEIISNVLKVFNNSSDTLFFKLQVLRPAEWSQIGGNRTFAVAPNDTLFAPVLLIPKKVINDNTQIIINAFLINEQQEQLANNFFIISTRKRVSWEVSSKPTDKIYFKNQEKSKKFSINILNTGNGEQDIFINQQVLKKNLIISDSAGNIIKEPTHTISLKAGEDTTMKYTATVSNQRDRNFTRISSNNYLPTKEQEIQNYSLYYTTSEPNSFGRNVYRKSNRIQFVKLPNFVKMNDFGYSSLPLLVQLNVQNILDETTFMSLNLNGFKQIDENSSLVYFSQLNYSNSFYTNQVLRNSPWYIGYFGRKISAEAGQISSNMIGLNGFGKGFRGSYKINDQNKTTAFWVRSAGYFGVKRSETVGLSHEFKLNNSFRITGNIGQQDNLYRRSKITAASIQPNFNFRRRHYFNLIIGSTIRDSEFTGTKVTDQGYLFGGSYSTNFLDRKIRTNIDGRVNDKEFAFGTVERRNYNHRTIYTISEEWNVFIANRYQENKNYSSFTRKLLYEQELFSNSLIFSNKVKGGSVQPGMFFDYRNTRFNEIYFRGLSFRYSSFNFKENYLGSFSFRAGYSLPIGIVEDRRRDYFTFQFNTLIRYRVWNFSARYNYGIYNFSTAQNIERTGITPQDLRLSLQNQHQFKNNHIVLESNAIYSYNNSFDAHTIGIFPEIFYFNNTGWRFSLNANYNFNTRKLRQLPISDTIANPILIDPERTYANNFVLGASVRKEFGVPIPFVKKVKANVDFLAFFDVDGDGVKGRDEPVIENVVISIAKKEIMTNEEGIATVQHIDKGFHSIIAFALADLDGWFPNVDDTIAIMENGIQYVPFTRGVKVYGDVVLDRQDIAVADTTKPFDLSRIKITASNGKVYHTLTNLKGRFEFYLPNGQYVITMDERILGERYVLTKNNIPITLKETNGGVYISFFIVEKRKKVIRKKF